MNRIQKAVLSTLFFGLVIPPLLNVNAERIPAQPLNKEVIISDQGLEFEIKSGGNTIEEVLMNANIQIYENDIVFPSLNYETEVDQYPLKIIIDRSTPISLNVHGKTRKIFTREEKVFEVLKIEGINFKEDDLINYNFYEEIFPGIEIRIWKRPKPKPKVVQRPVKIVKTGEIQTGIASWYSYIPGNFCASPTYKQGTELLVTNLENGKKVIVTVNDYGPFNGPIIDLEQYAFLKIAPLWKGMARVKVERIRTH